MKIIHAFSEGGKELGLQLLSDSLDVYLCKELMLNSFNMYVGFIFNWFQRFFSPSTHVEVNA